MKTPRDILSLRHQVMAPKLDEIRQTVVQEFGSKETKRHGFWQSRITTLFGFPSRIWFELIVSCRRIWLGFAAVWILLFIINFAQHDRSQGAVAQTPPSAGLMMAYRDQQRMLDELLADRPRTAAEHHLHNNNPRPRSEVVETVAI